MNTTSRLDDKFLFNALLILIFYHFFLTSRKKKMKSTGLTKMSVFGRNPAIVGHGHEVPLSPMDEFASIIKEVNAQKSEFANELKNVGGSKSVKVDSKPDSSIGDNVTVCDKKDLDEKLAPSGSEENEQGEAKTSTVIASTVNEKATVLAENFEQLTINKSEVSSSNQELSEKSTELEDYAKIPPNIETVKSPESISDLPIPEPSNKVRFSPESDKKPEQIRNARPKKKLLGELIDF